MSILSLCMLRFYLTTIDLIFNFKNFISNSLILFSY